MFQKLCTITFAIVFVFMLAPVKQVSAEGACLCAIQNLTKEGTSPVMQGVSGISTKKECEDVEAIQDKLDKPGKKLNVAGCLWQDAEADYIAESVDAHCQCKDSTTKESSKIKETISYDYPKGASLNERGLWLAVEGQKFCSKKTTSQKSCVFVDTVFGSGNFKSVETPLSTYAAQLNKLGTDDVTEIIARVIKTALGIAGTIAFVMFIYSGFLFMLPGGATGKKGESSKSRAGKAKDTLLWSTLGIFIIFASYTIINFIFEALT